MRRTIFVFAIMASLLILACAANDDTAQGSSDDDLFGGLKDTLKELIDPFIKNGVFSKFKLSSLFGLFENIVEDINIYEKNIAFLHERSLNEYKEIDSIRNWAQAAAEKAKKSDAITQKVNFIALKAEIGKTKITEIEKQKLIAQNTKKEADAAKKEFEDKEADLTAIVFKAVADLTTAPTAPAASSTDSDRSSSSSSTSSSSSSSSTSSTASTSSTGGLTGLIKKVAPIAADLYLSFKKLNNAVGQMGEAFEEAKLASENIRQCLVESQEIEKGLQRTELRAAARRAMEGTNGTMFSDSSSCFSLLQNTFFLTLVGAFLISDKPVWRITEDLNTYVSINKKTIN